nr:hypothetical protein Iba_chr06dCG8050 [Ipomoea batatas]
MLRWHPLRSMLPLAKAAESDSRIRPTSSMVKRTPNWISINLGQGGGCSHMMRPLDSLEPCPGDYWISVFQLLLGHEHQVNCLAVENKLEEPEHGRGPEPHFQDREESLMMQLNFLP